MWHLLIRLIYFQATPWQVFYSPVQNCKLLLLLILWLGFISVIAVINMCTNKKKYLGTAIYVKPFIIHCAVYLTRIEEYTERDIFYLYTMSPPYQWWLVSITSGFSPISMICYLQNMYYISLERSSHACYLKIHAEIKELLQFNDWSFYSHCCMCFLTAFSHSLIK